MWVGKFESRKNCSEVIIVVWMWGKEYYNGNGKRWEDIVNKLKKELKEVND